MIFHVFFILISYCSPLYANDDLDFFDDLCLKISLSVSTDSHRTFKFFVRELSGWMGDRQTLSTEQEQMLKKTIAEMKSREEYSKEIQLLRISAVLDQKDDPSAKLKEIRHILNQFSFHRAENTLYSALPKNLTQALPSYLSVPEFLQLQELSKGTLRESASFIPVQSSAISDARSSSIHLRTLPGYSTFIVYKESVVPLEAIRLLIVAGYFNDGFVSQEKKDEILSQLNRMREGLSPHSIAFYFMETLSASLSIGMEPFENARMAELLREYDRLAKTGNLQAAELMALVSACKIKTQGEVSRRDAQNYLSLRSVLQANQSETGSFFQAKAEYLPPRPDVAEFVRYQQLQAELIHIQTGGAFAHGANQDDFFRSLDATLESIANLSWATLIDQRIAISRALETRHYAKALEWVERIVSSKKGTWADEQLGAALAFHARDWEKASHLTERAEAKNPDASWLITNDIGRSAIKLKEFYATSYSMEPGGKMSSTVRHTLRSAAQSASASGNHVKAAYWMAALASNPKATIEDKLAFAEAAFDSRDYTKAKEWSEQALETESPSVPAMRLAAASHHFQGNLGKSFYWNKRISFTPEATLSDWSSTLTLAHALGKESDMKYWRKKILHHPAATRELLEYVASTAEESGEYLQKLQAYEAIARMPAATLDEIRRTRDLARVLGQNELALTRAKAAASHQDAISRDHFALQTLMPAKSVQSRR